MTPPTPPSSSYTAQGIAYGCDYNPEQWDRAVWQQDVALMREAGIGIVAINIFGWAVIEPREGEFDFSGLDTIIELLHANSIQVNLGTGTSSPPPWLTTKHPEILPKAIDGTTRYPGGRQAWCPSSPEFREHAFALVEQVARRYGKHPAVALWHVSNELGCHNALCYDDQSADAFRRWLRDHYVTVDALNAAWGAPFWSQRYNDWSEVLPPLLTLSTRNPTQVIDFHRFSSDELLDYYRREAEIIREHSSVPVTTNFMVTAHIRNLDYWAWAPEMDVVANDHYLDWRLNEPVSELSFAADLTRGLAGGKPWFLMEQAAGAVNWQPHNLAKNEGEMIRNSLTYVARGADSICFFQWRASLQGSEKFHSALLPHAGTDSANWRNALELGSILDRLGEVAGTEVESDVAMIFSWQSWWAADGETRPSQSVSYLDQVHDTYRALRASGLTVDVVAPSADLSKYKLVLVPHLYMVDPVDSAAITNYVAGGGHAIVTFYSGIVDLDDRVIPDGYPGAFRDMLGLRVEEFVPLLPGTELTLSDGSRSRLWAERMTLATADPVVSYTDGPVAGGHAVTRNKFGSGTAWYVSTVLEPQVLARVVNEAAALAAVTVSASEGNSQVEILRRSAPDRSYLFIINHGEDPITVAAVGDELITQSRANSDVVVPGGTVRVVREVRE
ncbi:MAG: beta-galactosidase [Rhodoglobus sp.]